MVECSVIRKVLQHCGSSENISCGQGIREDFTEDVHLGKEAGRGATKEIGDSYWMSKLLITHGKLLHYNYIKKNVLKYTILCISHGGLNFV